MLQTLSTHEILYLKLYWQGKLLLCPRPGVWVCLPRISCSHEVDKRGNECWDSRVENGSRWQMQTSQMLQLHTREGFISSVCFLCQTLSDCALCDSDLTPRHPSATKVATKRMIQLAQAFSGFAVGYLVDVARRTVEENEASHSRASCRACISAPGLSVLGANKCLRLFETDVRLAVLALPETIVAPLLCHDPSYDVPAAYAAD